jgi:hypothetical protein
MLKPLEKRTASSNESFTTLWQLYRLLLTLKYCALTTKCRSVLNTILSTNHNNATCSISRIIFVMGFVFSKMWEQNF